MIQCLPKTTLSRPFVQAAITLILVIFDHVQSLKSLPHPLSSVFDLLGLLGRGPRDGSRLLALTLLIEDVTKIHRSQSAENEDVAYVFSQHERFFRAFGPHTNDEAYNTFGQVEDILEKTNDCADGTLEDAEDGREDAFDDLKHRGKQVTDAFRNVRHVAWLVVLMIDDGQYCVRWDSPVML